MVRYGETVVVDMDNEFLHEGIPQRQLRAVISDQLPVTSDIVNRPSSIVNIKEHLLNLLSSPNIASKSPVIRHL